MCGVRCETGSHCAYLCTSIPHRAVTEKIVTIGADGPSGQWSDKNYSHGGAGGFPFVFGMGVGLVKMNTCR